MPVYRVVYIASEDHLLANNPTVELLLVID